MKTDGASNGSRVVLSQHLLSFLVIFLTMILVMVQKQWVVHTWQITSQMSSQPARSWKLNARSRSSPSDQTISVSCQTDMLIKRVNDSRLTPHTTDHTGRKQCVGSVMSDTSDSVLSGCVSMLLKENCRSYQHLTTYIIYSRTTKCIESEVKRSKVKITWLSNVLLVWVCRSVWLLKFLVADMFFQNNLFAKTDAHINCSRISLGTLHCSVGVDDPVKY